jgi:hypothetical protein
LIGRQARTLFFHAFFFLTKRLRIIYKKKSSLSLDDWNVLGIGKIAAVAASTTCVVCPDGNESIGIIREEEQIVFRGSSAFSEA